MIRPARYARPACKCAAFAIDHRHARALFVFNDRGTPIAVNPVDADLSWVAEQHDITCTACGWRGLARESLD